mmetsp:Transcript_56553/g.169136  ORF Transcript_56553/g.169136 Transcript_56553/m.169136 type:complete len:280 (+) Transcript_56553:124-963(+)
MSTRDEGLGQHISRVQDISYKQVYFLSACRPWQSTQYANRLRLFSRHTDTLREHVAHFPSKLSTTASANVAASALAIAAISLRSCPAAARAERRQSQTLPSNPRGAIWWGNRAFVASVGLLPLLLAAPSPPTPAHSLLESVVSVAVPLAKEEEAQVKAVGSALPRTISSRIATRSAVAHARWSGVVPRRRSTTEADAPCLMRRAAGCVVVSTLRSPTTADDVQAEARSLRIGVFPHAWKRGVRPFRSRRFTVVFRGGMGKFFEFRFLKRDRRECGALDG